VIKIVHKGQPGLNSGKAAEFRYLLRSAEPRKPSIGAEDGAGTDEGDGVNGFVL
jgi:hypothetical protein